MKKIILILLTLNLLSCSSYNKFEEYDETSSGFSFEEDDNSEEEDEYKEDESEDESYMENPYIENVSVSNIGSPTYIDSTNYNPSPETTPSKTESTQKTNKTNIIDNTLIKDIVNSKEGTIAYSVPKEMKLGNSYQIKLRITKQKGKEINKILIVGDRKIHISDTTISSNVIIENIRVESNMKAHLISEDSSFYVKPLNTEKQIIEDESYTEWSWNIKPIKSGKHFLKLIIKIQIKNNNEINFKDIVVFDKKIKIDSNIKYNLENWIYNYWQWLFSTIIIPFVIFLYKKRKKKS